MNNMPCDLTFSITQNSKVTTLYVRLWNICQRYNRLWFEALMVKLLATTKRKGRGMMKLTSEEVLA